MTSMGSTSQVVDRRSLASFIASCPIIDHHAHPLLPLSSQTAGDVAATVTEAQGDAQAATPSGLPFIRAVNGLQQAYATGSDEASTKERFQHYLDQRRGYEEKNFTRQSFAGIETILVDDGLRHPKAVHPYDWHSQFLKSPAKRIVRIETLAEDILAQHGDRGGEAFEHALKSAINEAIADKEVAGFKSVSP